MPRADYRKAANSVNIASSNIADDVPGIQIHKISQLREIFWKSYDPSLVADAVRRLKSNGLGVLKEVGEGRFFRSYELPCRAGMSLCIKEFKPSLRDPGTALKWTKWSQLIQRIQYQPLPLVPPMVIAALPDQTKMMGSIPYMVMPLGTYSHASVWLNPVIEDVQQKLRLLKVELFDAPLVLQAAGAYFLADWSDLAESNQSLLF